MSELFDLIVVGAGPGGYVAAIRAAQLGMKVGLIEKNKTLGGTCLNVGCIPSKALLESTELYHQAHSNFKKHGIQIRELEMNMEQMIRRKNEVVSATVKGIDYLMGKNKITVFHGSGRFTKPLEIEVKGDSETKILTAKKFIIATGSVPTPLKGVPFDGKRIISSTEALDLTEIPPRILVIGGGVIGVELGSVFGRLGSEITVVEFMDGLLPTMDRELGKILERCLKKINFKFHFNTGITEASNKGAEVELQGKTKEGKEVSFKADYVLVAIGRKPFTEELGLENIGLNTNQRGFLEVDENYQTSCPGLFAIGDCIPGPMLAHKASEEGVVCVEKMAGHCARLNYSTIPGVVYTWPEVASVGLTEEELKKEGRAFKKGSFPFKASGRARVSEESDGFIKVLSDKKSDEILGIHMIGPRCADMIGEAVVAMEYRATSEDLAILTHAHPTFSEAIKEAALNAHENRAIHL